MIDIEDGSPVRGHDGVDVFAREDGFNVEHFCLAGPRTLIVCKIGPFDDRAEADDTLRAYRSRWTP